MPSHRGKFDVIHAGALERAVGKVEAGRCDDVDAQAEAGGGSDDGAGIAGNVRLEKGDAQLLAHGAIT